MANPKPKSKKKSKWKYGDLSPRDWGEAADILDANSRSRADKTYSDDKKKKKKDS